MEATMKKIYDFIYQKKINKKEEKQMPLQIELFPPSLEEIEQYNKKEDEDKKEESNIIIIDMM